MRQTFWNLTYWYADGRLDRCDQHLDYDVVIDALMEAEDSGERSLVDCDIHEDGNPPRRVELWNMVYERRCDNEADMRHAAGAWR